MKIDSHQHFWKYDSREYAWINDQMKILRRDYLPSGLKTELKRSGFQGSIAVQARQTLEETQWLLELADQNAFIKGVVGWVDLCSPDVEQQILKFVKNPRFVGVRHIIQDEADEAFMLRADFSNGLYNLQKYDLTYDLLIFPRHLPNAVKLVARFPDLRIVIDHLAKPVIKKQIISPWREGLIELAHYPNTWCKISGMVTEADWQNWKYDDFVPYLDTVLDSFGPERVLFGSDWPVCTLAGNYQQVLSIVLRYIEKYSVEQQSAISGENARKVYKIKS
jgi:L-fucono-1,5-lactonase